MIKCAIMTVIALGLLSSCGLSNSTSTYYRKTYTTDSTIVDVSYDSTITYLNK
jgi:hypothetical protein